MISEHERFAAFFRDLHDHDQQVEPGEKAPKPMSNRGWLIIALVVLMIFSPFMKACGA